MYIMYVHIHVSSDILNSIITIILMAVHPITNESEQDKMYLRENHFIPFLQRLPFSIAIEYFHISIAEEFRERYQPITILIHL